MSPCARKLALRLALLLCLTGCGLPAQSPVSGYRVIKRYPHDRAAFTQGLIYLNGVFYEGTGLNGESTIRKVEVETGKVLQKAALPQEYFGEGITVVGDRLIEVTWTTGVGFVYDLKTFHPQQTFRYHGEGWGLTYDGSKLILSDGTNALRFLDPSTFREIGQVKVMDGNNPVTYLNELEWIKGEVWANVWQTDRVVRISPITGKVIGWVDFKGLLSLTERLSGANVLNGIAYDAKTDRIFVTGKLWPYVFEIKLAGSR